jgi:hypothetical protein
MTATHRGASGLADSSDERSNDRGSGTAGGTAPSQLHRTLALLALLGLFLGTRDVLQRNALPRPELTAVLMLVYGALLALAVLVATVRSLRAMTRVDAAILLVGLVRLAVFFADSTGRHTPLFSADEGALVTEAARSLAHGGHIYGVHFTGIAHTFGVPMTHTMTGGLADTFGYPPLSVLLTALFTPLFPSWFPVAAALAVGAVALAAVLMFVLLPAPYRSAAVLSCLAFDWMFSYPRQGYPVFLALPLLVVVFAYWTRTGAGGRLGRRGTVQALCLGLACSAHQLPWFVAPFLLAGILLLRRGELPWRDALLVTARYAGLAALAFVAVNLLPLFQSPGAWIGGLLTPLTQHIVPQGLGPVVVPFYLTGGSGALDWFGYAALALLLGLLAAFVLFPRRMGPAVAILPWITFYLTARSTETYFVLLAPVWAVTLATTSGADFARAWQWRPAALRGAAVRRALPVVLVLPAAALLAVAVLTPAPLRLAVVSWSGGANTVRTVGVDVTNTSGDRLSPHFTGSQSFYLNWGWRIVQGPATLAPHQHAHYELRYAGAAGMPLAGDGRATVLHVLTDGPQTMSNTTLKASARTP